MIKKIIKFLIYMLILSLLAIFSVSACLFIRIPLWYCLIIFFGTILSYFITKHIYARTRSYIRKRKVNYSSENTSNVQLHESFLNALLQTKRHKKQNLKKLPWFFLLGATGNGKSSLINRSKTYSLTENSSTLEANINSDSTSQCWTLNDMVIAEASGGIFDIKPSKIAINSWKKLIDCINSRKRHIDLKGIILTISIEQLFGDTNELMQYGLNLRKKVEYISKKNNYNLPVYLVITKSDELQGFSDFSLGLPESIQDQAFGQLFSDKHFYDDPVVLIDAWIEKINVRINAFNAIQIQLNGNILPRTLLLQNNIKSLKAPLTNFLSDFYRIKSPIKQDNPILRGLFFTSSEQDAVSSSMDKGTILEHLSLQPVNIHQSAHGLFTYDLFTNILPSDYAFKKSFSKKISAKKRHYNEALIIWWSLLLGCSAYLGISYSNSIRALMKVESVISINGDQFGDNFDLNLLLMSGLSKNIDKIKNIRKNWIFSSGPYSSSLNEVVISYQKYYVKQFNIYLSKPIFDVLAQSAHKVSISKHRKNFGDVVSNIIFRINLIQAKLNLIPSGDTESLLDTSLLGTYNGKTNNYAYLYKNYVAWNDNLIELKQTRGKLLNLLDSLNIISMKFEWIKLWIDSLKSITPIKESDYWPENNFSNSNKIDSIYTQAGFLKAQELFENLQNVQLEPTQLDRYKLKFFSEYDIQRYKSWKNFTKSFTNSIYNISSESYWDVIARLKLSESPYRYYSEDLANNFSGNMLLEKPEWLNLLENLSAYFKKADLNLNAVESNLSLWGKITNYTYRYSNDLQSTSHHFVYNKKLLQAIYDYLALLSKLKKYIIKLDDPSSFDVMKSLYSHSEPNSADKSSSAMLFKTYNAYQQIKYFSTKYYKLKNQNEVTWSFLRGQFDLIFYGLYEKAMCHIEQKWNSDVLYNPSVDITDNASLSLGDLFGEHTIINKFLAKYVYPFVSYDNNTKKYVPKSVFGHDFDFSNFLYKFIEDKHEYTQLLLLKKRINYQIKNNQSILQVSIKPTNLNKGAKLLTTSTSLSVVCNGKKQILTNYDMISDYAISNDIFKCTSAKLSLNFDGAEPFSLIKKYKDNSEFLELIASLNEHRSITLHASDFPSSYMKMKDYNIKTISVFLSFKGLEEIAPMLSLYTKHKLSLNNKVNKDIINWNYSHVVSCWDNDMWQKKYTVNKSAVNSNSSITLNKKPLKTSKTNAE